MKTTAIIRCVAACAAAVLLSSEVRAEKIDITAGAEYELADAANQSGNTLAFAGDATVKLNGAVTDGTFEIKAALMFEGAGTVTIDTSALEGCTKILSRRHVRDFGLGGTLAFPAGVTEFRLGAAKRGENNALSFPSFEADATFAEAGGKVIFENDAAAMRLPTAYEVVAGSRLAVFGENLFGAGDFTLGDYDVELCATNGFSAGATVTVPVGRRFYIRICALTSTPANGNLSSWTGEDQVVPINVALGGAGATLLFQNNNSAHFAGDITGEGTVNVDGSGSVSIVGDIAYTGLFYSNRASDNNEVTYHLRQTKGRTSFPSFQIVRKNGSKVYLEVAGTDSEASVVSLGSFSASGTESVYSPNMLHVGANQTIHIGTVSNVVKFVGEGKGAKVIVDRLPTMGPIYPGPNVDLTVKSCSTSAKIVFSEDVCGTDRWFLSGPATGDPIAPNLRYKRADGGELADGELTPGELTVGGLVKAVEPVRVAKLTLLAGATLTGTVAAGVRVYNNGGTFASPGGWRTRALLWNDAMVASSFVPAKANLPTQLNLNEEKTGWVDYWLKDDQIVDWLDCRPDNQARRFRVVKYDPDGTGMSNAENIFVLFPKQKEQDGKPSLYLDTSKTRARIYAATGISGKNATSRDNIKTLNVKCAVFAFNGALGGGNSLFTSTGKTFLRVSELSAAYPKASDPIVKVNSASLSFRKNGTDIDCTTTGLDEGWQVLSFTCNSPVSIYAIGPADADDVTHLDAAKYNGGQIFGEILFFEDLPTADEILDMEKYLADKWGVAIPHAGSTAAQESVVFGSGSVGLSANTQLTSGDYSGTIDLNGYRLTIPAGETPFTEAEIPSADRVVWIDPSQAGAVVLGGDPQKPDEISHIFGRDNQGDLLTADGSLYATSPYKEGQDCRVRQVTAARSYGTDMPWLDYRDVYSGDVYGNALMFGALPYQQLEIFSDTTLPKELKVKSGFFVLDSSRDNGGTLVASRANGSGAYGGRKKTETAIFSQTSESADVRAASAWLDGVAINPAEDGFSGKPEVAAFTLPSAAAAPGVKTAGFFGNTSGGAYKNPEFFGEFILYSTTQSELTCKKISAYLMQKWLGTLPDGFSSFRAATVTGVGTVVAEGDEYLPTLGAGFSGSVELTRSAWDFTLGKTDAETDTVDLSGRTLALPTTVTVNVTCRGAAGGRHPLFKFGTLTSATEFVLGTVTGLGTVTLVVEDGVVYADYTKSGVLLIVR